MAFHFKSPTDEGLFDFGYKAPTNDADGETKLLDAFKRAMDRTKEEAIFDARAVSRGGLSYATLNAMGNPYSRKNPGSLSRLGMISRHKDEDGDGWDLYEGWGVKDSGPYTFQLRNTSKHALWVIEGTKRMIPRYIVLDTIDERVQKRLAKNVERELSRLK